MIRKSLTWLCLLSSLNAAAGTMGTFSPPNFKPVIAGIGGYAALGNFVSSQAYYDNNFNLFTFNTNNSNQGNGYGGGFLGYEMNLPWYSLFYQLGIEYLYYGSVNVTGTEIIGVNPNTSSAFAYQYQFQTQQIMASLRLLTTVYNRFHPYFSVSIGGASNSLSNFAVTIPNVNAINVPAQFASHSASDFTYSLGVGVDTDITETIRVALGYRFSDFGQSYFNPGFVVFNNYTGQLPFAIGNNHVQANAFFAQLSYIFQ